MALGVLGCAYLLSVFLGTALPGGPSRSLPDVARYFTQVACLFPRAATHTIDYRLEVWRCEGPGFEELDLRSLFPVHPDDKENRFHRVGHFYRRSRPVMRALERYVVAGEGARTPERPVGGVRVSSLRIPLPELGSEAPRWKPEPLQSYPVSQRKVWYYTPVSRRRSFCAGLDPDAEGAARRKDG